MLYIMHFLNLKQVYVIIIDYINYCIYLHICVAFKTLEQKKNDLFKSQFPRNFTSLNRVSRIKKKKISAVFFGPNSDGVIDTCPQSLENSTHNPFGGKEQRLECGQEKVLL